GGAFFLLFLLLFVFVFLLLGGSALFRGAVFVLLVFLGPGLAAFARRRAILLLVVFLIPRRTLFPRTILFLFLEVVVLVGRPFLDCHGELRNPSSIADLASRERQRPEKPLTAWPKPGALP